MRIKRIAASYHPLEWWYPHLCHALDALVKVGCFPATFETRPGYSWSDDLSGLMGDHDWPATLCLGSVSMLHPDLPNLPCPTAVWYDYFPHHLEWFASVRLFDFVFVTSTEGARHLLNEGLPKVHWLPHAFDSSLEYDQKLERIYEVGFVGATNLKTHDQRRRLLPLLAARYKMNDYTQPVFRNDLFRVYNQCRIVVNIPNMGGFNMRNFEAMACGAMLVTENVGHGQGDLFREGEHLVTYAGPEDLFGKIDHYLKHESERRRIAAAGQAEVIAKHSYRHRAQEFLQFIEANWEHRGRASDPNRIARAYAIFYHRHQRLALLLRLLKRRGISAGTRLQILSRFTRCFLAQLKQPSPV